MAGQVSYASIPIEHIDWTPFDIVGVDAYRNSRNAANYRDQIRQYFAHGKPVAVTEAGCCAYRGAADLGAGGWTVIEADGLVRAGTVHDEGEQVRDIRDLLPLFQEEGIDTTFWFSFAGFELPHRTDLRKDLDLCSYRHREDAGRYDAGRKVRPCLLDVAQAASDAQPGRASQRSRLSSRRSDMNSPL